MSYQGSLVGPLYLDGLEVPRELEDARWTQGAVRLPPRAEGALTEAYFLRVRSSSRQVSRLPGVELSQPLVKIQQLVVADVLVGGCMGRQRHRPRYVVE